MKTTRLLTGFSLLAALTAGAITSEEVVKKALGVPRASIRIIPKEDAPEIDGVIREGEWASALKFCDFEENNKGVQQGKTGYVLLTTDRKNLYIAVRTNTPNLDPGGGLITRQTERDSAVWLDDSIELIFTSAKPGSNIYQFIFNSRGVLFDQKLSPEGKLGNASWNASGMAAASLAQSGWWELEVKIPLSEIECATTFRMNLIRNWGGSLRTALSQTQKNFTVGNMAILEIKDSVPVIRCEDTGRPAEGKWFSNLHLSKIPEGKVYTAALLLQHHKTLKTQNGPVRKSENICLSQQVFSSDGKLTLIRNVMAPGEYSLYILVADNDSEKVIFRRRIRAKKGAGTDLFPPALSIDFPENIGYCKVWQYPGFGKAVVQVTPFGKFITEKILISRKGGMQTSFVNDGEGNFKAVIPIPDAVGKYEFDLTMFDPAGKKKFFPKLFALTKKKYPWEGNTLGQEKIILPPFTPLKADKNVVSALYRNHSINSSGLWDSIESKGRELLNHPMRFEAVINGKSIVFSGTQENVRIENNGHDAVVQNRSNAEGISLESRSRMEYDGFYWSDFKLYGAVNNLERLTLVIPFKNEEARLFHAVVNSIRNNPGGNISPNDGLVWDGSKLTRPTVSGKEVMHPQLVPYIWIGTEARGISFFVETSFGMKLRRDIPAVRMIRKKGELCLEVDIINRKTKLKEGHAFSFGLQATPVKPIPEWAYSLTHDDSATRLVPGMRNMFRLAHMLVGYPNPWARHPVAYDYSAMRAMVKFLKSGGANREKTARILDEWEAKHEKELKKALAPFPHPSKPKEGLFQHRKESVANDRKVAFRNIKEPTLSTRYSDPRLSSQTLEEDIYFRSEWSRMPIGYPTCYRSFLTRTNLDYTVWCYAKDMENGQEGIYLDDTFIMPNFNTETDAKIDNEGETHSAMGLLAMRELVKRIANLQHKHGFSPRYLEVHMTNALLIPCFSFATAQLGWEAKFNEELFQKKYPSDYIRAVNIGDKLGTETIILPGAFRTTTSAETWRKEKRMLTLTRSQIAMLLPHDLTARLRWRSPDKELDRDLYFKVQKILSDFGIAKEGTEFLPYWDHPALLPNIPPEVMVSAWKRGDDLLFVIGNQTGKDITIPLDRKLLDKESGEFIDKRFILKGNDFRILGTK